MMKTSFTTIAIYDWSAGMNIDLAHDVEMYLYVIVYHKYNADKQIHIDTYVQYDSKIDNVCRIVLE